MELLRRVFLISDDEDFSDWIKEELKNYARVVRVADNSNFFVQQWETSEADIAIVLDSGLQSTDSFDKAHKQIRSKNPNVPFVFIYSDNLIEGEEGLRSLEKIDLIWINWNDLDIGLIETRLEAFFSLRELQSSVFHSEKSKPSESVESAAQISLSEPDKPSSNGHDESESVILEELSLKDSEEVNSEIKNFYIGSQSENEIVEQHKPETSSTEDDKLDVTTINEDIHEVEKVELGNSKEEVSQQSLLPRTQKSRKIRPKLPSLPKHGEVRERVVFTERIIGTVIIALAGTTRGAGATHNSIQIARYLKSSGFEVACVEMLDSDRGQAAFKYFGEDDSKKTKIENGFHLNGIDFYKEVDPEKYVQIIQAQYQYVVVDLGQITFNSKNSTFEGEYFREFLRSHLAIICVKSAIWDFPYLIALIDKLLSNSWNKPINLFFNFADESRFKYFCSRFEPKVKKALQLQFYHNSFLPNPFEDQESSALSALLEGILPKTRKGKFFSFLKSKNRGL